ncbi:unnamed protein product [Callosobruchus maculatus]|nr:unnamed protein product [Callosobruchus maculatus]
MRDLLPGTFVFQLYGQSEVAGALTMFNTRSVKDLLLLDKNPSSVGKVIPGIRCKSTLTQRSSAVQTKAESCA